VTTVSSETDQKVVLGVQILFNRNRTKFAAIKGLRSCSNVRPWPWPWPEATKCRPWPWGNWPWLHRSHCKTTAYCRLRKYIAHCWNSYVSEMQLWFVTVSSSNELDQCPIWDTRRLDAVHEINGLASYLITCKSYEDTDWTLADFEWILKTKDYFWVHSLSYINALETWLCSWPSALALALRVVALGLGLGGCGLGLGLIGRGGCGLVNITAILGSKYASKTVSAEHRAGVITHPGSHPLRPSLYGRRTTEINRFKSLNSTQCNLVFLIRIIINIIHFSVAILEFQTIRNTSTDCICDSWSSCVGN